jgi:hypothetical protein
MKSNSSKDYRLSDKDHLVSFDVVSLFTSIPIEDTMKIIRDKFKLQEEVYQLIYICLTTTYFKFNDRIYEQTNGVAMGSPLSPIIAEIFMEHLENQLLESSPFKPTMCVRYVDDVFLAWPHGEMELHNFLKLANEQHPNIAFTMEREKENKLPFLDVLVMKENNHLMFRTYKKPTHTNRYIDASSHHHPAQLNGVIKTLYNRITNICDPKFIIEDTNSLIQNVCGKRFPEIQNNRNYKEIQIANLPLIRTTGKQGK